MDTPAPHGYPSCIRHGGQDLEQNTDAETGVSADAGSPGPGGARARKARLNFSLRLKIILTFLLVGTVVSGLLSFSVYRILDAGLLRQMQGRVQDLARLGAQLVDADALGRLKSGLGDDLSDKAVDKAESSKDFVAVSNALNQVRGVERTLVHFIYTFSPTADSGQGAVHRGRRRAPRQGSPGRGKGSIG